MSEVAVSLDEYFADQEAEEIPEPVIDISARRASAERARALLGKINAWKQNYGLERAACLGLTNGDETPVDFHPEDGASDNPARLVCNSCPEQDACLRGALDRREKAGIWGGAAPNERRNIRANYKRFNIASKTGESLGDFAVRTRSRYIAPADPLGVFDSRQPQLSRVQADALCLTEERDLFESLDSGNTDEYIEEMLVSAQEICKRCINFKRGCNSNIPEAKVAVPTVLGSLIIRS